MNLTLEGLLDDLEKQAGIVKSAADNSEEGKKKEEKEKEDEKSKDSKDSKDEKSENPFAKKEGVEKSEKEVEESSKKDEGQTKEAQLAGAALAKEIMEKVAGVNTASASESTASNNKENPEMNKQASAAGKALADALLEKLANAGDQNTANGIPAGVVPNKNQVDNAAMEAQGAAAIKPTPTKDAAGNGGGSINQIFDAIVADTLAQGAATPTEIAHVSSSAAEGAIESHPASGENGEAESAEKTAALVALVNSGFDFDTAVNMVKQAEAELASESDEQVKQAAFAELVEQGIDPLFAQALVKSAGIGSLARDAASAVKAIPTSPRLAAESLAKNRLVQGVAAGGALGGAAALAREKKAAFDALVEAGVDFEKAAQLVAAKSQELYGA